MATFYLLLYLKLCAYPTPTNPGRLKLDGTIYIGSNYFEGIDTIIPIGRDGNLEKNHFIIDHKHLQGYYEKSIPLNFKQWDEYKNITFSWWEFKIKDYKLACDLFKFLALNSDVEFSLIVYRAIIIIYTAHNPTKVAGIGNFVDYMSSRSCSINEIIELWHSHPTAKCCELNNFDKDFMFNYYMRNPKIRHYILYRMPDGENLGCQIQNYQIYDFWP